MADVELQGTTCLDWEDIAVNMEDGISSGVEPSPCFSNFLARTTFVLESLPEAKNPGQDAFLGILSLTAVILDIKPYLITDCDYW